MSCAHSSAHRTVTLQNRASADRVDRGAPGLTARRFQRSTVTS